MKVIDTVLSRKIYEGDNAYEERVKQAGISFKAGIQEVVDWTENNYTYNDRMDTISFDNREWSDKLKEWGIDNT